MDGRVVLRVADECAGFLDSAVDQDWTASIPGMEWTVAQVVAHMSECVLWYSIDLAAGERALDTMEMRVRPESEAIDLVATLRSAAGVLARVVDGMPPDSRGWHPHGRADASGFAAMACDEMLVHTADAGHGLGRGFVPSAELSDATVRRLFPWAPTGTDPWATLLWANGRADLPGHERQVGWKWHCAPLDEWDGVNPSQASDPKA
ncbi:maleylpyruvate isomerase N-terminal domain-containing protein [Microtetraspora malaysiensis]|uniref:Maleylpyruvate isomerase N-terminal domain-containing protein n=1 Tax=Microtetraspora malaysiensis TaxID=161358 RepID=A0ABW6T170_9ACTN